MTDENTKPVLEIDDDTTTHTDEPARAILFNDEIHTFDEVIAQIKKATGCGQAKAETLTWEVHSKGKACVWEGTMERCIKVVIILEEIQLHTQIEM
ncbi:MAG: ATP-dependent Clp protease adaptor ClpS [Bacteroidota bacterium]